MLEKLVFGPKNQRKPRSIAGRRVLAFLALVVFCGCLTALSLSMREVLGAGGACGYIYQVPCRNGVAIVTPLSVPGLIISAALYAWTSHELGGINLTLLMWPAMFGTLGYNFFDYGTAGPTVNAALLSCAVVFAVIALAPLVLAIWFRKARLLLFGTPVNQDVEAAQALRSRFGQPHFSPSPIPSPPRTRHAVLLLLNVAGIAIGTWCGTLCWALSSS